MRILGIDPAIHITGYGLIELKSTKMRLIEAGFIKTLPNASLSARLNKIYSGLTKLISDNSPNVLVLEKLYAHIKHPTTAFILGHARGVVCLAASLLNVPIVEFGATKVKKAITGSGSASKSQVQRVIQHFLNLKEVNWREDISDALALAITYANIQSHNLKGFYK